MKLPNEILQQIIMYCEANNIGMAELETKEGIHVNIIIMGDRSLSPDQVSVIAAHMLLSGVIHGRFNNENERKIEEKILKVNLN